MLLVPQCLTGNDAIVVMLKIHIVAISVARGVQGCRGARTNLICLVNLLSPRH